MVLSYPELDQEMAKFARKKFKQERDWSSHQISVKGLSFAALLSCPEKRLLSCSKRAYSASLLWLFFFIKSVKIAVTSIFNSAFYYRNLSCGKVASLRVNKRLLQDFSVLLEDRMTFHPHLWSTMAPSKVLIQIVWL